MVSADPVLAADVEERIQSDPRTRDYGVICPQGEDVKATIEQIERMSRDTVKSRLLVFDVRGHTLPRLQHAYNKVVGYNRKDLNQYCHSILIGDGPASLFQAGKSMHVFLPHLARHRIDYYPAVFFYDPFLHYTEDERQFAGIDADQGLPQFVPRRLEKAFGGEAVPLSAAREYLRAAAVPPDKRGQARQRRQQRLVKFYRKRIAQEFPHHTDQPERWLSREGYALAGEALRLHLYPLFFEDWVAELMSRAGKAR